jgi:rhamnogalacturonan endolyase
MKQPLFRLVTAILAATCLFCSCNRGNVSLSEDELTYTLDNGIVTAVIAKASGDLVSLQYKGKEMLATRMDAEGRPDLELDPPGANPHGLNPGMTDHQYGFWSHDAMGPRDTRDAIASVTINPARNGHKRAEVSVKGISEGRLMGTGPGAPQTGQFSADVEIRYAIEDGAAKVWTYCIFTHPESYPASAIGEARFCAKLAPIFDWMSVDEKVDFHYPKEHFAGDKYVYTAVQSENPAFGWSSTTENVGCFILNPSMEYMSGGPTKVEFMGHRDTNEAAAPCILNYWRSSHYGGAEVVVRDGEFWEKVIGPFVIYLNEGADHDAIYADARAAAKAEAACWPYDWVDSPAYAKAAQRSTVNGKLVPDASAGVQELQRLRVGLTDPESFWQRDAKHYQFWTVGNPDGSFTLPNVRAGKYTLVAFADGILGELTVADVEVPEGGVVDLGEVAWKPRREGRQVFEIGIPNRNGSEFRMGGDFRDPEVVIKYAQQFPKDVTYTVGKSDFRKDWPYLHVPHNTDPDVKVLPFFGIMGNGRATPFQIRFKLDAAPAAGGKGILRLAICGTAAPALSVAVNSRAAGDVALQQTRDGVITRHGSHGIWYETEHAFDARLLRKGDNVLTLTVPAGSLNSGILYDYLRLELAD